MSSFAVLTSSDLLLDAARNGGTAQAAGNAAKQTVAKVRNQMSSEVRGLHRCVMVLMRLFAGGETDLKH